MLFAETFVAQFHDNEKICKMQYNYLGKTGLKVSKLGTGGGVFGGNHTYGDYDEQDAIHTIIKSFAAGVNYIDTAPFYGYGKSEILVGKALKNVPRNAYHISTKVGRCESFDFSAAGVTECLDNSLRRLGLDYVDLVIIHDVEFADDINIILNETIPAVKEIIDSGKARFLGISGYPISTLVDVINRSKTHIDFILTYCRDTLIDNTLQQYIPELKAKGVGIINAGCVAMGLLTNNGPPAWHPATDETKALCQSAAEYCKENGVELGRLALYHCLNQPGYDTCLIGMNSPSLLDSNLDVLFDGLSDKEEIVLEQIKQKFFLGKENQQWEGIEIARFKEQAKLNQQ